RAPGQASALRQGRDEVGEVSRARRKQRLQARRPGRNRCDAQAVEDEGVESLQVAREGQSRLAAAREMAGCSEWLVAKAQNPGHNSCFARRGIELGMNER